jgi:hypothetical protein
MRSSYPHHVGIGQAGDEIGRTWPQRGEAHPRFASQPAIHVRHERRALLMARHDEADGRAEQRVEQIQVLLARHAEDVTDTFVFQAFDDEFSGFHGRVSFTWFFRARQCMAYPRP